MSVKQNIIDMIDIKITNERVNKLKACNTYSKLFSHYGILLCEFLLGIVVLTWLISKKTAISLWERAKAEVMKVYNFIFQKKSEKKTRENFIQKVEKEGF